MNWEKLLKNKSIQSPSVSFCQSLLSYFSTEFLFTEVLYCGLFGQIQPGSIFWLLFLALQQLLVRFWVREDSSGGIEFQAFGLDRYRSQTARLHLAPTALQFELLDTFRSDTVPLNTVDIGFSPSNSTSHIWNTTANCPRAACVCRCVCLRNGMLAIILLTMSVCK